jgi:polyisoprenyl-phosphate glycosyltransferase
MPTGQPPVTAVSANAPQVSIVVPLYNEAEVFAELLQRLQALHTDMAALGVSIELLIIDDGSTDSTPLLAAAAAHDHPWVSTYLLARNFGHQAALCCGLEHGHGTEAVFIIDGDLQDPPELLAAFLAKLRDGHDVVYGIRRDRKESFLKRLAYSSFYRVQRRMTNVRIPADAGDFCLLSRRMVNILNAMPERNRFLRGMRAWVGFKQFGYEYERAARTRGATKFTLRKLINLAADGIFNFSSLPLRFILNLGFVTLGLGMAYLLTAIVLHFTVRPQPKGHITLVFLILLLNGVQFVALGIIGQYILRIFNQTLQRPTYVVDKVVRVEG